MAKISDFFTGANAKTRIVIVVAFLAGLGVLGYLASNYLGGSAAVIKARMANVPAGLQSVPGGQLTPEYYRALQQNNTQTAKQSQLTGTSSVPTLMNVSTPSYGQSNCTIMCGEGAVDTTDDVNTLLKNGKITQQDANQLLEMAKNNVPVSEYEANLERLVKEGKITPEEARRLLAEYKKQHANALAAQSAQQMDPLIKAGKLPVDVANDLLDLQKKNVSPQEYAAELARLVKEGKISPQVAAQLLAQYTQQKAKESASANAQDLQDMVRSGQITQDVANDLAKLQAQNVPVSAYQAELNRLVAEGKLTPAAAALLLAKYKAQKAQFGPAATLRSIVAAAEKDPKYDKQKLQALRNAADSLEAAQANNVTAADYADRLKKIATAGILTAAQAAELLQEYQAYLSPPLPTGTGPTAGTTTPEFAALQERLAAQQGTTTTTGISGPDLAAQIAAEEAKEAADAAHRRAEHIQALMSGMSGQAAQLVSAWEPPTQQVHSGEAESTTKTGSKLGSGASNAANEESNAKAAAAETPPLIKAGTIYYAMLTTAVDSDYPDTPVLATIVDGPFKGAHLIGKLSLAQGMDKLSLNFNLMDEDSWPKSKTINAYAMDPDTAKTVMASNVNHHYMLRYGTMFASSFLTGYASSITNAGTSTTGIFGTSSTHPTLSPGKEIAVGLGQVGTAFSAAIGSYINTPATVKINSGVGIGLLFVSDVT